MALFHRGNTRARRLNPEDVLAMREAYAAGATQRELCQHYRISIGQVGRIVRGEAWAVYPQVETDVERTDREFLERRPDIAAKAPELVGDAPLRPALPPDQLEHEAAMSLQRLLAEMPQAQGDSPQPSPIPEPESPGLERLRSLGVID